MKKFYFIFTAVIAVIMTASCGSEVSTNVPPVPTDDNYVVVTDDYLVGDGEIYIDRIRYMNPNDLRVAQDSRDKSVFTVSNGMVTKISKATGTTFEVSFRDIIIDGKYAYINNTWYRIPDSGLDALDKYTRQVTVSDGVIVHQYGRASVISIVLGFSCIIWLCVTLFSFPNCHDTAGTIGLVLLVVSGILAICLAGI